MVGLKGDRDPIVGNMVGLKALERCKVGNMVGLKEKAMWPRR